MKEAYERFEMIREIVSAEGIVDAIAHIFSTDQLNELCDDLCHEFDIEDED